MERTVPFFLWWVCTFFCGGLQSLVCVRATSVENQFVAIHCSTVVLLPGHPFSFTSVSVRLLWLTLPRMKVFSFLSCSCHDIVLLTLWLWVALFDLTIPARIIAPTKTADSQRVNRLVHAAHVLFTALVVSCAMGLITSKHEMLLEM